MGQKTGVEKQRERERKCARAREIKRKREKDTEQLPFQSTVSKRLLCCVCAYVDAFKARRKKKLRLQIRLNRIEWMPLSTTHDSPRRCLAWFYRPLSTTTTNHLFSVDIVLDDLSALAEPTLIVSGYRSVMIIRINASIAQVRLELECL